MARSLLVHARLPDTFMFHALAHASRIFNVLPVRGLYDEQGNIATPHLLFLGNKPRINHFCIFGSPVVARKWSTIQTSSGKQTEQGVRGIFIGFDMNQKGYLFYSPGSRQIYISGDKLFDESFGTAIAATWQMHQDSLTLRPFQSHIPTTDVTLEQTGPLIIFSALLKRGITITKHSTGTPTMIHWMIHWTLLPPPTAIITQMRMPTIMTGMMMIMSLLNLKRPWKKWMAYLHSPFLQ